MKINSVEVVLDNLYRVAFSGDRIRLSIRESHSWHLVMSQENPVFGMGTDDGTYGVMGRRYPPSVETAVEIVRVFKKDTQNG